MSSRELGEMPAALLRALQRAPVVPEEMIDRLQPKTAAGGLSASERWLLRYLSHGLSLRQAADAMDVRYLTAKGYARSARFKLRAKTATHAVANAIRLGEIP